MTNGARNQEVIVVQSLPAKFYTPFVGLPVFHSAFTWLEGRQSFQDEPA
jgi:hypothetical protein